MKRFILIGLILMAAGCTKLEQSLYCTVSMQLELPDGRNIVALTVDPSLQGNRFQNLNTGINYPFPTFVNNRGQLQVQKGVYMVSFDGDALFADGTHAKVRFYDWSAPSSAIRLIENTAELKMKLVLLP